MNENYSWVIFEAMGHVKVAGRYWYENGLHRIDIPLVGPENAPDEYRTERYGPEAVYRITGVDEQTARLVARECQIPEAMPWEALKELQRLAAPGETVKALPQSEPEIYDYDDDDFDEDDEDDFFTKERDKSILWARKLLESPFVVLDTETTGLDADDVAVSIGVVDHTGNVLLDTYVKPWKPIPEKARLIHGITDEMVKDAPTILEIEPRLVDVLGDLPIVIYNVNYDRSILQQSFAHTTGELLPRDHWTRHLFTWKGQRPVECAMEEFAKFYGVWNDYQQSFRWQKLIDAAAHFGISTDGAHGAVKDCLMTLGIVKGMAATKLSDETDGISF